MNQFTILNYQGSKKNLIDFIHESAAPYIDNKAVLDIFAGTCSVGYSYKSKHIVYANDCELYSFYISKALLSKSPKTGIDELKKKVRIYFDNNYTLLMQKLGAYCIEEKAAIKTDSEADLQALYNLYPTIWNGKGVLEDNRIYNLFSLYYAGSYFGIEQAFQIDSIRCAIDQIIDSELKSMMMSALFFAMKESVFAKDGHMAQPLDPTKNRRKLMQQRSKSIEDSFWTKMSEFYSDKFVNTTKKNKVFNMDFNQLLRQKSIIQEVGFIYADPPYTDMQYSRYYHLLNVVAKYDYPKPSIVHGKYTKGLYTENRYQSALSQKANCLSHFTGLIDFSKEYKKNLAISFAYPVDPVKQKTDRYVMSIDQIILACSDSFGAENVEVASIEYTHSNNRNSEVKNVIEYLVLCRGR